jgi:hypothetical protein
MIAIIAMSISCFILVGTLVIVVLYYRDRLYSLRSKLIDYEVRKKENDDYYKLAKHFSGRYSKFLEEISCSSSFRINTRLFGGRIFMEARHIDEPNSYSHCFPQLTLVLENSLSKQEVIGMALLMIQALELKKIQDSFAYQHMLLINSANIDVIRGSADLMTENKV